MRLSCISSVHSERISVAQLMLSAVKKTESLKTRSQSDSQLYI